jgi:hypothetical protein
VTTLTTHHPVALTDPCACSHTLAEHATRHCHHAACGCTSWRKPGSTTPRVTFRDVPPMTLGDVVAHVTRAAETVGDVRSVIAHAPTRGMQTGRVIIRAASPADADFIGEYLGLEPHDMPDTVAWIGPVTLLPLSTLMGKWTVKVTAFRPLLPAVKS